MTKKVNIALQVLPITTPDNMYKVVDKAIEVIKSSGIKHRVCPFETVMEGEYDHLMQIIKKIQEACFTTETEELILNLKIQVNKNKNIIIEDKTNKYDKQ